MRVPLTRHRLIVALVLASSLTLGACGDGATDPDPAYTFGSPAGAIVGALSSRYQFHPFGAERDGPIFLDGPTLLDLSSAEQAQLRAAYRRGQAIGLVAPQGDDLDTLRAILGSNHGIEHPRGELDLVVFDEGPRAFREFVIQAPTGPRRFETEARAVARLKEWLGKATVVNPALESVSDAHDSGSIDVTSDIKAYNGSQISSGPVGNQVQVTWETFPFYSKLSQSYFIYVQQSSVTSLFSVPLTFTPAELAALRMLDPDGNFLFTTASFVDVNDSSIWTSAEDLTSGDVTVFHASPPATVCCPTTYSTSTSESIGGGGSYSDEDGNALNFGGSASIEHSSQTTVPPLSISYEPDLTAGSPKWLYHIQDSDGGNGLDTQQEFILTMDASAVRRANGGISPTKSPKVKFLNMTSTSYTAVTPAWIGYTVPGTYDFDVTLPPAEIPAPSQPELSSVTPGKAHVGDSVVVVGKNLSSTTAVLFGATPGLGLVVKSDTELEVLVPTTAPGTVPLTVEGGGGDSNQLSFRVR